MSYLECHSQNVYSRRGTHYPHVSADDNSPLAVASLNKFEDRRWPLSLALCLMVIALSEEVWYRTFQTTLATMDLTSRFLRYVDNRLCLVDPSWLDGPAFVTFLHREFYGAPIILETEPDQEFLHQYRNLGPTTNTRTSLW